MSALDAGPRPTSQIGGITAHRLKQSGSGLRHQNDPRSSPLHFVGRNFMSIDREPGHMPGHAVLIMPFHTTGLPVPGPANRDLHHSPRSHPGCGVSDVPGIECSCQLWQLLVTVGGWPTQCAGVVPVFLSPTLAHIWAVCPSMAALVWPGVRKRDLSLGGLGGLLEALERREGWAGQRG